MRVIFGVPKVNVPVLSKMIWLQRASDSRLWLRMVSRPWLSMLPVAALMAVGVASDSAQGQVTTSTATRIGNQLSGDCCHQ